MRRLISCWILLTIAGGIVPAADASYTPASLAMELRRVKKTLEEGGELQALRALPPAWRVETPERSFSISSEPLRLLLANPTDRQKGAAWLDHLAENLEGSVAAAASSRPQEHAELARILARPEFAANAPPTRWELFQQRVINWIREVLTSIFSYAAQHPTGSTILFWVVVTGAIGILGSWLLRLWTHANQTSSLTARWRPATFGTAHRTRRSGRLRRAWPRKAPNIALSSWGPGSTPSKGRRCSRGPSTRSLIRVGAPARGAS